MTRRKAGSMTKLENEELWRIIESQEAALQESYEREAIQRSQLSQIAHVLLGDPSDRSGPAHHDPAERFQVVMGALRAIKGAQADVILSEDLSRTRLRRTGVIVPHKEDIEFYVVELSYCDNRIMETTFADGFRARYALGAWIEHARIIDGDFL